MEVAQLSLPGAGAATLAWLGVIQVAVWLIGRPRSIAFVKAAHTVIFVALSGLLAALVYEVVADRVTLVTWAGVTMFLAEGIVLAINGGRCPLTALAEQLGSPHGQITDTLLPKWFADRVFRVYGVLFAGALVILAVRALGG
jgi:hypothetical protein